MGEPKVPPAQSPQNSLQPVLELLQGGDPEIICKAYGITRDELEKRLEGYMSSCRQVALIEQLSGKRAGRNEPCPCGSGKKFKKCCLPKYEEARKNLPLNQVQNAEDRSRAREKLEEDVRKGFDLLLLQDFSRAQLLARRLLESYPEDDRLHNILVTSFLATGDYDAAFDTCRERLQVALDERDFFQENGYHKREGRERDHQVHFFTPAAWLETFWIAQRARVYREAFPCDQKSPLAVLVRELECANDARRFPSRQEDGFQIRKEALSPVLARLERVGAAAIPYLLPLTYYFSWASLFVPDLLLVCGSDESLRLLAELSMFRLPYFAEKCLVNLEQFKARALPFIDRVLSEDPGFDELKGGLIMILGKIPGSASLDILERLVNHENIHVVKCVTLALEGHDRPEGQACLQKAKGRLAAMDKVLGVLPELVEKSGS